MEGRIRSHYRRRSGQLWDAVIMGLVLDPDAALRGSGLLGAASLAAAAADLQPGPDEPGR